VLEAAPVAEPIVGDIKLVLTYPPYTGRAPLVVPVASGDILAPRGTVVALETTALRPAASALMIFDGGAPLAMKVEGKVLRAGFTVDKATQFRFLLTPIEGAGVVEADRHRVDVEPDRAPRVELIAPADELDVSARKRVEIAYSVDDDYGIGEIALVWQTGGKEERWPLPRPRGRSVQSKFFWDLSEATLKPGTRTPYWLEAKDNDDVGGPNVGKSRTFYLRVFSPAERHGEVIERQQALLEETLGVLAGRLEADQNPAEVHGELERLVMDVGALVSLVAQDTLAPKGLKSALDAMSERLVKVSREEQTLLGKPGRPKELGDIDRRAVAEIERDALELDDWIARQRVEEMLALTDEIRQHKEKLKELLEQYQRAPSERAREEIEREIRAIEQRIAQLEAKMAKLGSEVADKFMNTEAMTSDTARDCFGKVRELVAKGDIAGAQKQLEQCSAMADRQAEAMEAGLKGLRGERFADEEKALAELMGEIGDLERDQRRVAGEADDLLDRYKEKAAEAAKNTQNPQREKAKKTLEKLKKEVGEIPREGLTPFSQEELDALKKRLDDVDRMLNEGDLAEAQSMAKQAQDGLRLIGADIEDDLAGEHPWSPRTWDAQDKVGKSQPLAKELVDDLKAATPRPEALMGADDRQKMNEMRRRQQQLLRRAQELVQKAKKGARDLPGQAGEAAQKGLGEAGEKMGRASERFGAPDPLGARDEAQGAADKLAELQGKMSRASRPQTVGGRGRDDDDEPVKIPGSEEYKPPEAFREDILDAMKKEKPPEPYKDQVKRYYEELVK
jgi:soluble cytochrome b562